MFRVASDFRPFEIDDAGSEWSPESGYKVNQTFPVKAFKSEAKDGLLLNLFQDEGGGYNSCPYDMTNSLLKVIIHSPGEFPRITQNFFNVPFHHEVFVAVKPVMTTTTTDLGGYSTDVRQCYFSNERSLKFFKFYSQNNCEHECFTNFTLVTCGCVKVSMPRDNDTVVCAPEKFHDLFFSEMYFRITRIDGFSKHGRSIELRFNLTSEQLESIKRPCECLPSCVSLDYELLITQSEISSVDSGDDARRSRVHIHFKAASLMKLKRSELYGWGDFIANCGGLLGKATRTLF